MTAAKTAASLIVEIKGYRREDAKEKKLTMDTYWVPGVNNNGQYGRWAFAEFTDASTMESEFEKMLHSVVGQDGILRAVGSRAGLAMPGTARTMNNIERVPCIQADHSHTANAIYYQGKTTVVPPTDLYQAQAGRAQHCSRNRGFSRRARRGCCK